MESIMNNLSKWLLAGAIIGVLLTIYRENVFITPLPITFAVGLCVGGGAAGAFFAGLAWYVRKILNNL